MTLDVSPTIALLTIGGTTDIISLNVGDQTLTITGAVSGVGLDILPLGSVVVGNGDVTLTTGGVRNAGAFRPNGTATLNAVAVSNSGDWQVQFGTFTLTHATPYTFQQQDGTLQATAGAGCRLGPNGTLSYLGGTLGGGGGGGGVEWGSLARLQAITLG